MIVYRIEHSTILDEETGHPCGPMTDVDHFGRLRDKAFLAQKALCKVMDGRLDKPTPFWDIFLNGIQEDEICGVDSMRSMEFWFEDTIPVLKEAGFVVSEYEVPDWACRVGMFGQVVFKYEEAEKVSDRETISE